MISALDHSAGRTSPQASTLMHSLSSLLRARAFLILILIPAAVVGQDFYSALSPRPISFKGEFTEEDRSFFQMLKSINPIPHKDDVVIVLHPFDMAKLLTAIAPVREGEYVFIKHSDARVYRVMKDNNFYRMPFEWMGYEIYRKIRGVRKKPGSPDDGDLSQADSKFFRFLNRIAGEDLGSIVVLPTEYNYHTLRYAMAFTKPGGFLLIEIGEWLGFRLLLQMEHWEMLPMLWGKASIYRKPNRPIGGAA